MSTGENAPARVRLSRAKGYRKPEGAVVVARPSRWGNPFPWHGDWIMWMAVALGYTARADGRRAAAVDLYRAWLTKSSISMVFDDTGRPAIKFGDGTVRSLDSHARGIALGAAQRIDPPPLPERPDVAELRGCDLACWCPLDQPCHADVLLEVANA